MPQRSSASYIVCPGHFCPFGQARGRWPSAQLEARRLVGGLVAHTLVRRLLCAASSCSCTQAWAAIWTASQGDPSGGL